MEYWNAIGGKSILDQIDLSAVHYDIVREEQRQYPGWENRNIGTPSADYIQRSCREWELASRVLVNSEWCASALIRQGVAAEKIMVVPQAYSGIISPKCNHYDGRRNLHVLFLGNVNLAKGAHYLLQAAEKLTDSAEFYFAGNIHFLTDKIMNAPSNVTFLGAIPPAACVGLWQWADVLVFPTLSDGFGIVQLEAMAYGVPVIATDRCGQVVTDEKNGFVIPVKDAAAIVEKLEILANKPELLKEMSIQATETLKIFNLDRYYQNVETLFAGETKK
ncbi:D-inositol-3-phosphate glycosyltransferase [bioreactor metagenome]|uniref:D-inositol-3-phosphate glycosyltransferase n=1 Tax=bioreactor metagenome TaxID=1076179 RepID=A0A645BQW7_9ZZZZ